MNTIVEQIESFLGGLQSVLSKLYALPALSLIAILCFAACYALKQWKRFPNEGIPAMCVAIGAILAPMLADPRASDIPIRAWIIRNAAVGAIIGLGTTVAYRVAKQQARRFTITAWLFPTTGDTMVFTKSELKSEITHGTEEPPK